MYKFSRYAQNNCHGRFSIPVEGARLLGIDQGDLVTLCIASPQGVLTIEMTIKSGLEIYGGLNKHVRAGDPIKVIIY